MSAPSLPHPARSAPDYLATYGPALIGNGFHILPIKAGEKRPDAGPAWQHIAADRGQLDRWLAEKRGLGVGILGEHTPGIDLDITDGAVLDRMLAWCAAEFGPAPKRIGRAPRALLVCRADVPVPKKRSRKFRAPDGETHQVEIIGRGGQFVAHAVHPDTGQPCASTTATP